MIASRIWRALFSELDSASTFRQKRVVPELPYVLTDSTGRIEPRLEAFVADTRHHCRDKTSLRWAKIHGLAGTGGFGSDAGQRVLARTIVRQRVSVRFQYGAVDLAETPPLVLHAHLRSRREHERRGVGRDTGSVASSRMLRARSNPRRPTIRRSYANQ